MNHVIPKGWRILHDRGTHLVLERESDGALQTLADKPQPEGTDGTWWNCWCYDYGGGWWTLEGHRCGGCDRTREQAAEAGTLAG